MEQITILLKYPLDDIVSVGQRTLLYRDLFTVAGYLEDSVTTNVATVGLTPAVIVKTTDLPSSVSKQ